MSAGCFTAITSYFDRDIAGALNIGRGDEYVLTRGVVPHLRYDEVSISTLTDEYPQC